MEFNNYLKPIIISLYKSGVITRESLINSIREKLPLGPLQLRSGSSIETDAFHWIFDMLFEPVFREIISRGLPSDEIIKKIAIEIGLYNPQYDDNAAYQRSYMLVRRAIRRMFSSTDLEQLYRLFNSGNL